MVFDLLMATLLTITLGYLFHNIGELYNQL